MLGDGHSVSVSEQAHWPPLWGSMRDLWASRFRTLWDGNSNTLSDSTKPVNAGSAFRVRLETDVPLHRIVHVRQTSAVKWSPAQRTSDDCQDNNRPIRSDESGVAFFTARVVV